MFPRYKTMHGCHCPRRVGWDTHGLPVEHEIEKELGIFNKSRIEREVGVEESTREKSGLRTRSYVMIDHIFSARTRRVGQAFGRLDDTDMLAVNRALAPFIGIAP